jgi:hypothetical protein
MIEIRVWGEDNLFSAQVIKPLQAPDVAARRADHAVLKALTAYRRTVEPMLRCEQCGAEWWGRGEKQPKLCPRCRRPPVQPGLVRLGLFPAAKEKP